MKGQEVGSLPFYVPSLNEGMQVSFVDGSVTNTYVVKSWRFVVSSHPDEVSGLMVEVRKGKWERD
jgi:prepilin-type processing-associated H-X9-DG protein